MHGKATDRTDIESKYWIIRPFWPDRQYCQRAHRKFFLPRYSEFSYDEDVKRCMQCIRYLVSDRNTSPGQDEDDHVISVPKLAEFRSEQKAGFKAIREQHGPSS